MSIESKPKNRIGLHYFPDTLHYREQDLETWLPEIKALGASWLTIQSPSERAIPEHFISGLTNAGVEPIIHLRCDLDLKNQENHFSIYFENYARWGAKYLAIFDRPNTRKSWLPGQWGQTDLVENYLDLFIPLAENALLAGLNPILSPLEPGGDYWDLAFLQSTLQSLLRRGKKEIIEKLIIGAYAWTSNKPLNWGAGGPESWPNSQPYYTPDGSEDHLGFRIYEWYQSIARSELGKPLPIIALGAGCREKDARLQAEQNMEIILFINDRNRMNSPKEDSGNHLSIQSDSALSDEIPDEVLAINLWLLATSPDDPFQSDAWFSSDGSTKPIVNALKQWLLIRENEKISSVYKSGGQEGNQGIGSQDGSYQPFHPIDHYLLLPLYAWGVADWDLDTIRPYIQEHHPTVGFSINEACLAAQVTVLCDQTTISSETLERLRKCGCTVEGLSRDGTILAV
jgi:hypothetical protein